MHRAADQPVSTDLKLPTVNQATKVRCINLKDVVHSMSVISTKKGRLLGSARIQSITDSRKIRLPLVARRKKVLRTCVP